MKIVIDLQALNTASRYRGVGRYMRGLTNALLSLGKEEIILVVSSLQGGDVLKEVRSLFKGKIKQNNIRVFATPFTDNPCGYLEQQFDCKMKMSRIIYTEFLNNLNPDIYICGYNFDHWGGYIYPFLKELRCKKVCIHYDLFPMVAWDEMHWDDKCQSLYFERIHDLNEYDAILCDSEYVMNELTNNVDLKKCIVETITAGINSNFLVSKESLINIDLLHQLKIEKPFMLYAGGSDERKNVNILLYAYLELDNNIRDTHQLVIVCGGNETAYKSLVSLRQQLNLSEREVVILGYVSDETLATLYRTCKLFVFPSLYEGFGLTPLEAMNLGAAVIGSNTTAVKEVIEMSEAMFDPKSVESIAEVMGRGLLDEGFRQELLDNGKKRIEVFNWNKCADKCMQVFEKIINDIKPDENIADNIELNRAIRCLKDISTIKEERMHIAMDLAVNFPPKKRRQLLIDIGKLAQDNVETGIQRIVYSIIRELSIDEKCDYDVKLVYACVEKKIYVYANKFSFKHGMIDKKLDDCPIEFYGDDIFLGLYSELGVVPNQEAILMEMFNRGVKIYFFIYDLVPIFYPQSCAQGAHESYVKWLEIITKFNGVICISKSVAVEIKKWCSNKKISNEFFDIHWVHLGTGIVDVVPSVGLPIFREVAEDNAFYISGERPENFAEAVQEWPERYIKGNYPNADNLKVLTWKESKDRLIEIIQNL